MTPEQMRRLAEKLMQRFPAPTSYQRIDEYYASLVMHQLASCLGEMADEDDPPARSESLNVWVERQRMTALRQKIDALRVWIG